MECPYKKDIYFFEYKNNFAIVHIFYQYVKRLNILYTYSTDKLQENELYVQIMNWAINNDIDLVWAINRNTELKNIFPTIFDKPLKFAAWSLDEKTLWEWKFIRKNIKNITKWITRSARNRH